MGHLSLNPEPAFICVYHAIHADLGVIHVRMTLFHLCFVFLSHYNHLQVFGSPLLLHFSLTMSKDNNITISLVTSTLQIRLNIPHYTTYLFLHYLTSCVIYWWLFYFKFDWLSFLTKPMRVSNNIWRGGGYRVFRKSED